MIIRIEQPTTHENITHFLASVSKCSKLSICRQYSCQQYEADSVTTTGIKAWKILFVREEKSLCLSLAYHFTRPPTH